MKTILGTSRHQMQFTSLDDFIAADNPVRIIDVFVEKLDPIAIGWDNRKVNVAIQSKIKELTNRVQTLFLSLFSSRRLYPSL